MNRTTAAQFNVFVLGVIADEYRRRIVVPKTLNSLIITALKKRLYERAAIDNFAMTDDEIEDFIQLEMSRILKETQNP